MDEGAETKKGRLFGLLRLVLAVAILAWIARALPWKDNLTWHDGAAALLHIMRYRFMD